MTVNKAKIIERIILRICKDFEFADKISSLIFPPCRIIRRLYLFLIQEISSLETRKGIPLSSLETRKGVPLFELSELFGIYRFAYAILFVNTTIPLAL